MSNNAYLKRTIVKETITSKFLPEGERQLRVFLPPGYNDLLSYPIVYCQDGEEFFNFGRIATTATKLILDDGLEPFIIVGVEVNVKTRTAEYDPNGDRHKNYVSFFGEEVIPFIEQKYAVRNDPTERLLAGDSLGGTVSLHIALSYPTLFHRVLSLSGAFYSSSQQILQSIQSLDWLTVYMIVGLQEDAFETDTGVYNFVELNRTTRDLLLARNATVYYEEKDGKHQWGFWQKELPQALTYFIDVE
ncbi:alpha/beta hydrolase [Paenibacillus yanchengensis]|uniref:Alpha/beta hydrolase n=1 Tax=Paenibacillus yanchengensis TaxID=2035833 RepID=A0ABW4YQ36_9BACL